MEDRRLWGMMQDYLDERGLDFPLAVENGWFPSSAAGDSWHRIVIPATNSRGMCFWQARAMSPKADKRYQSPHVPRMDSVIQVWPWTEALTDVVLVEGPMDALACAGVGYRGIAMMGATPSREVLDYLAVLCEGANILFVADRDAISEAQRVIRELSRRGRHITLLDPYPYKDIAAAPQDMRTTILESHFNHRGNHDGKRAH